MLVLLTIWKICAKGNKVPSFHLAGESCLKVAVAYCAAGTGARTIRVV